jgi:predicted hydrocarbon binding protein
MEKDDEYALKNPEAAPYERKISHFRRREVQAPVAACLIREFAAAMGRDKAVEAAATAIRKDARNAGRMMAEKLGGQGLAELSRVVREVWAEDDAISIRMLKETDRDLGFDVTRCRYAEMYEALGMKDLGFCLSCSRDAAFAEGFNSRIRLSRTQTIMQGAAHCDFRFTLE